MAMENYDTNRHLQWQIEQDMTKSLDVFGTETSSTWHLPLFLRPFQTAPGLKPTTSPRSCCTWRKGCLGRAKPWDTRRLDVGCICYSRAILTKHRDIEFRR